MAAIINEIIPLQGFDIVETRIGEILLTELTNQKNLQGLTSDFGVFLERQEPMDKSEDVVITVTLMDTNFSEFTTKGSQGNTIYVIDVYASGTASDTETASINSRIKIHKYVGMIRYILSSAKYLTLGFPPGLIGGKYVERIHFDTDYSNFGNHSNFDGSFIRFARIFYAVRIQEDQELWTPIALEGADSVYKLDDTEKGTQIIFNN